MHLWHKPASEISKPVDSSASIPEVTQDEAANGLVELVASSETSPNVDSSIHSQSHRLPSWVKKLIPGLEKWASEFHFGNFVVIRTTNERVFETMPIYARIGMHLLFYGKGREKILGSSRVEDLLKEQSEKQGRIYDSPTSVENIPSFIETYKINLDELLYPDIKDYKTFNEFFYRALKPGMRPVTNASNPLSISSSADCRLTVYQSVPLAQKFWIKGDEFSIPSLLSSTPLASTFGSDAALAIFRLAPADYHRFHCPIDGVIMEEPVHVDGNYYTVNPQAVNEVDFDVFTANVRAILYLHHPESNSIIAFVAIGALLVGSIVWSDKVKQGEKVNKGDELGYFKYGGSTVIAVFQKDKIRFSEDIKKNSEEPVETYVKVGEEIGVFE